MKSKNTVIVAVVVVLVAAGALIALQGGKKDSNNSTSKTPTTSTSSTASGAVATDKVSISDFEFSPAIIKVKVGTAVTWTNNDSVQHTVTADTISADAPNGPLFGHGETYSFTFNKAGTYTFHCNVHPNMHGTVVVTE